MPIKALFISTLEPALNLYLQQAENSAELLAPLADKVIALTVQPFAETFYLCPTETAIQILDSYPHTADTHLTGSLMALGLMGIRTKPMRAIFSGEIAIDGDMETGRKLQQLFAKLDLNWQGKLARFTGDTVAHNLSDAFQAIRGWSKDTLETFKLNSAEYLQEESRDLPAGPEIEIFYEQVDSLRTDYDRLLSRIERLEQTLAISRQNE